MPQELHRYTFLEYQDEDVFVALESVVPIAEQIFQTRLPHLIERARTKRRALLNLALDSEQVVGFKLGYERSEEVFYSWLGGVLPQARGHGVAWELMRRQHEQCGAAGYQEVLTETKNIYRSMLILNLKFGFDLIGTWTDHDGQPKLMLRKYFTVPSP